MLTSENPGEQGKSKNEKFWGLSTGRRLEKAMGINRNSKQADF
jgi:hypothetical protein